MTPAPASWETKVTDEQPGLAAWPSAEWWRSFNSPQLDELIAAARAANDDLAAAAARVAEADARARIAGAATRPALALGASGARERQRATTVGSGATAPTSVPAASSLAAGPPRVFDFYEAELTASYELDFWGRYRALRGAARLAAMASRYDRATVELSVMTSVARAYFQVLTLRRRLEVAADSIAGARRILEGLKFEQQVGVITALDVVQQQASVEVLEASVPPLKQQLAQTLDALALLIGRPSLEPEAASGSLEQLALPGIGAGLPAELLARRPDVAEAEAQLVAANFDVAAARAAFFPSISLTASGGYASMALTTLFEPASGVYALGAGLTAPLFQGGQLAGQYAYSKARYAELLAGYHKAVSAAFANTQDALAAVQQTEEQQRRQQQAADSARTAYELSLEQMHAGTINVLTVLNTQSVWFTAEDALVQARLARLNALLSLFNALGGGWQRAG